MVGHYKDDAAVTCCFCNDGIKTKMIACMSDNPAAGVQFYLSTPDGILMKGATDALDTTLPSRNLSLMYHVTMGGRIAYESAFAMSDMVQHVYTYNSDLIKQLSSLNENCLLSTTGLLTLFNYVKADSYRETMAEMVARLTREKVDALYSSPQGPKKDDDDEKPKARNWNEYFEKHETGKKYKDYFEYTGIVNPKDEAPIKRIKKDIPDTEMFKKDHYVALDRFHKGDHFEVWDKKKNWIGVANLDGSKNIQKTNAVKDGKARQLPK